MMIVCGCEILDVVRLGACRGSQRAARCVALKEYGAERVESANDRNHIGTDIHEIRSETPTLVRKQL